MHKSWLFVIIPCFWQCSGETSSSSASGSTGGSAGSATGGAAASGIGGTAGLGTFNVAVSAISGGQNVCLPRALAADTNSSGRTHVIAAHAAPCVCSGTTRIAATGPIVTAVRDSMAQANVCTSTDCQNYCVCEAAVASSDALQSCLTQPDPLPSTVNGWCYIDPAQGLGSSAPLTDCGTTQRMLRFAGDAAPKAGEMYYLAIE